MSGMKLILPKNIKVYVCTPWDVRNGSINDNEDYTGLAKLTNLINEGKSLDKKGITAKLSVKLNYAHYCPVIVIDYATGLFANIINYGFYKNSEEDFFNNSMKNCQHAYETLEDIVKSIYPNSKCNRHCTDNKILGNLDYADWICSDDEDIQVCRKYVPLSTTIMSHIMSGKDKANQLLNDNDNVEVIEWDWGYDALSKELNSGREYSDSQTRESSGLKTKIDSEYTSICNVAKQIDDTKILPDSEKSSIEISKTVAESLHSMSENTNDLEALKAIYGRVKYINHNLNKASALSQVLELDAQFSDAKHGLESSLDTLNSLLDMKEAL